MAHNDIMTFEEMEATRAKLVHLDCALRSRERYKEADNVVNLMLDLIVYYDNPSFSMRKQCDEILMQYDKLIAEFDAEVL
jgi:hypothetical protein